MTPIQHEKNYSNLTSLEGTTLDGTYLLGQCLGADAHSVTFKAQVNAGTSVTVIVKMYRAEPSVADEQIAVWEEIKKLKHPNLSAILGSGRTKLQEHELIYVATERADERLDNILRERPLDVEEAGELVVSICGGLEHLHASGFVHGSVSPEEVLGVGDAIKLSTERVRKKSSTTDIILKHAKYRAPENPNCNVSPEADVWCLGATLVEALTQKDCGTNCSSEGAKLPAPFASIADRCLDPSPETRCTLQEVVQLYEGRLRAFSAAAGAAASGVRDLGEPPSSAVLSPTRTHLEPPHVLPSKNTERQIYTLHTATVHRRIWVYLAIALLLVGGLIWLARPRKSGHRGSASYRPAPQQQSGAAAQNRTPQVNPQPIPAQVSRPLPSAPVVHGPHPNQAGRHQSTTEQIHYVNGPIWRVVVYTYDVAADAEKTARSIREKHPDLKAEVFSPNANGGPYLVVIGGQMNRDNAVTLRRKARRLGLPRDTYIQNYKQ